MMVRVICAVMASGLALCVCGNVRAGRRVREPSLAGRWYAGERTQLRDAVDAFCKDAPAAELPGRLCALVVPHAAHVWSGRVAGHAYGQVQAGSVKRVVLLAPSHYAGFRGFSILEADAWRTPLGEVAVDTEVCRELRAHKLHVAGESWHKPEHSLEIQLPFLQHTAGDFKLVPVLVGQVTAADTTAIAAAIKPYITGETLVVASSDFTHYGPNFRYVPFTQDVAKKIRALDMGAVDLILRKDVAGFTQYFEKTQATICGRWPIAIMLQLLPPEAEGKLLQYDTSGRMSGDYANSVSYAALAFSGGGLSEEEQRILLRIARTTLNTRIKTGRTAEGFDKLYNRTSALKAKSGVFVTLKKEGRLRGCIGRIGYPEVAAQLPALHECVRLMTVESATGDPRFAPVTGNELKQIHIEISVLTIAREVGGWKEFSVGRDGIIIRKGRRGAVFLPQVAPEQGWDRAETLSQLCRKAGLAAEAWREPGMKFFTFTAQVFDESLTRGALPEPKEMIR